jgi:hypothetical protein
MGFNSKGASEGPVPLAIPPLLTVEETWARSFNLKKINFN